MDGIMGDIFVNAKTMENSICRTQLRVMFDKDVNLEKRFEIMKKKLKKDLIC